MPRELVVEKHYRDVIRQRCYPTARGFTVEKYADGGDATRCLVAIRIPEQRDDDRPFLVLAPLSPDGDRVQGWLLGLPTRSLDETEQMRASELHGMITRGRALAPRLDALTASLAQVAEGRPSPEAAEPVDAPTEPQPDEPTREVARPTAGPRSSLAADAEARGDELAMLIGLNDDSWGGAGTAPTLYLVAMPTTVVSVPTIFRETGVRETLMRPPSTRQEGWNLATGDRPEIVEGNRLRLRNGDRKAIELYEDGVFVAAARLDRFFARGAVEVTAEPSRRLFKLNPLALIEFIHDFVLTSLALLESLDHRPPSAYFHIGIRAARGSEAGSVFLPPHGLGSLAWEIGDDAEVPDTAATDWGFVAFFESQEPGATAFRLVERLYAFFKRTVEEIPYLNAARDAVDPASFPTR